MMFKKKICERCGKEYRRSLPFCPNLCMNCAMHCSKCGKSLPISHWSADQPQSFKAILFGSPKSEFDEERAAWAGTGLRIGCFREQEKLRKEEVWRCIFCQTLTRGTTCSHCGAPRKV